MKTELKNKKLHEVLDLVLELDEIGKADAFFSFSGHCDAVSAEVYLDGWKREEDSKADLNTQIFLGIDEDKDEENLDDLIGKLKDAKAHVLDIQNIQSFRELANDTMAETGLPDAERTME